MSVTPSRAKLANDPVALSRVETLLLRYPDINEKEREEVGSYLLTAPQMDIGLLSTNQDAWDRAERFQRENPALFRTRPKELAIWAALASVVAGAIFLLWDFGLAG